jgi:hypothetical protein
MDSTLVSQTYGLTTKGQLLYQNSSSVAQLSVGADAKILTAEPSANPPLVWADTPLGAFDVIGSAIGVSNANIITVSNIPSGFTDILVGFFGAFNGTTGSSSQDIMIARASAPTTFVQGFEGIRAGLRNNAVTQEYQNSVLQVRLMASSSNNGQGVNWFYFPNYSNQTMPTSNTVFAWTSGGAGGNDTYNAFGADSSASTSPISAVRVGGSGSANIDNGAALVVFGIK